MQKMPKAYFMYLAGFEVPSENTCYLNIAFDACAMRPNSELSENNGEAQSC